MIIQPSLQLPTSSEFKGFIAEYKVLLMPVEGYPSTYLIKTTLGNAQSFDLYQSQFYVLSMEKMTGEIPWGDLLVSYRKCWLGAILGPYFAVMEHPETYTGVLPTWENCRNYVETHDHLRPIHTRKDRKAGPLMAT